MITQDDKRDFRRMQLEVPIRILVDGNAPEDGICRDLSATGLAFASKHEFVIGQEVQISISAGGVLPPLEARVSVVRSDYERDTGYYEMGGKIIEILQ